MDFTINSLTLGTGTSTNSSNVLTIAGTNTLTIEAATGTYSAGTGIVMLSGAAASTISANIALGGNQTWTNNSANLLTIGGTSGNTLSGNYNLTLTGSGNIAISDPIQTGAGSLSMTGSGVMTLTGTNSYSGGTYVTSGAMVLNPAAGAGFSATGTGDVTVSGSGVLATTGGDTISGNLNLGTGTPTVVVGDNLSATPTLTVNQGGLGTGLNLPTAGGASFDFTVNGTANSSINIAGGTLNFGTSGTDTINVSGTVTPNTYVLMTFAAGQTGTPSFVLGSTPGGPDSYMLRDTGTSEELIVGTAGTPSAAYWGGAIDGNWNTLSGSSTNWLNGPAGTDTNQIPGSTTDVYLTANSTSTNSTSLGQDFTINSLTFTGSGTANTAGSSIASGSGGPYTLTLDAAAGAYAAGTGITVLSGSGPNSISANLVLGASQTWNLAGGTTLSVSGAISESTAGTGLALTGSGTVALGGNNTYSGGTSINTGTVSVSADNNLGATSGAVTFTGGGTLAVTTGYTSQHNFAFGTGGGNIDVTGGQTFTASGTWTSTGGGVTLTGGGTVELNPGSYGSADNPLSVTAANGSLTGTATVLGSITIGSGGTVSPGTSTSSPGTLTFSTGTSTLDAGGTLDFNLTSAGTSSSNTSIGSAGTSWNLLAVNTLAASGLSSSARFDVTATSSLPGNFNPASSYQWDIITAAGGLPGGLTSQDFSLNTAALGVEPGSFSIAVGTMTGGVGYVAIDYSPSAVPEPGSMLLAGLAALGMAGLGWRRRRQRGEAQQQNDTSGG